MAGRLRFEREHVPDLRVLGTRCLHRPDGVGVRAGLRVALHPWKEHWFHFDFRFPLIAHVLPSPSLAVDGRLWIVVAPVEPVVFEHWNRLQAKPLRLSRSRAALEVPLAPG